MNYQHSYHAGNHADVFKHLVLMALIHQYRQKDKAFCVIDTHAGEGKYNLTELPNQEYLNGIGMLSKKSANVTQDLIKQYLLLQKDLTFFSGSPHIAYSHTREQDELILIEKADDPYQSLKRIFSRQSNVHIHHLSCEVALKSLLPPKIKRAIVFIDPTYEETDEYSRWLFQLKNAFNKFSTACYVLWFPIKSKTKIQFFYDKIQQLKVGPKEKLLIEFCPLPSDVSTRFNGSGMLIINPPYQFEQFFQPVLAQLIELLRQDRNGFQQILKV